MEKLLHIITVIYNFLENKSRYELTNNFINKYQNHPQIKLYVVELAYGEQEFRMTDPGNSQHLQVRGKTPLWHKENLINLGVEKLIPNEAEYIAWVDGNVEFVDPDFVEKTIEKLQNYCIVQMFSKLKCVKNEEEYESFWERSCGKGMESPRINSYLEELRAPGHTGFAFATTCKNASIIFPIYDKCIVGGGDFMLCLALYNKNFLLNSLPNNNIMHTSLNNYIKKVNGLKMGYIDSEIIYFYHGSHNNRNYNERWKILENYDPNEDIEYNNDGIIEFKGDKKILKNIIKYFYGRREDD